MISTLFLNSCPNCKGDIDGERLQEGLVCERCIQRKVKKESLCKYIKEHDISGNYRKICDFKNELHTFEEYFERTLGNKLYALQRNWAAKYFSGKSFALLAPTGVGKTTLGLMLAKYNQEKGKKTYLLFPTQLLVNQATERLLSLGTKKEDVLSYNYKAGARTKEEKELLKKRIYEGNFKILITTTMFLYKNLKIVQANNFELVFIDDVDSIIKSSKRIDDILQLVGFSVETINKAYNLIKLKENYAKYSVSQDENYIQKLKEKIEEHKITPEEKEGKSKLIVSTATSSPRSRRIKLFSELLDFQVGRSNFNLRNVEDVYEEVETFDKAASQKENIDFPEIKEKLWKKSIEKIKELGKGGLLFLNANSVEELKSYIAFLKKQGIDAFPYYELDKKIKLFIQGKAYPVGFPTYKNPLARGLDLPKHVRYALFVGVPKFEFNINLEKNYYKIYFLLLSLIPLLRKKELISQEESFIFQKDLRFLRQNLNRLLNMQDLEKDVHYSNLQKRLKKIMNRTKNFFYDEKTKNTIATSEEISLRYEGENIILTTADVTGYIQASGRTSRLCYGGLIKGLAYLLVDDKRAFNALKRKVKYYNQDVEFKNIKEVNLKDILAQVDKDREKLETKEGREKDFFKTALFVVESPNKARTIANFFGEPLTRKIKGIPVYETVMENTLVNIVSTRGHMFDLNKERDYFGVKKELCNGKKMHFVPLYELIEEDRKNIIDALREASLEISTVYLATDPDTEGEKIGYDTYLQIKPYNGNILRTEFHEVTRKAIKQAIKEAKYINENMVKAQIVRRVADRWVGFVLSQYLQRELKDKNLSAGRVQTPVLEWIVRRTEKLKEKVSVVRVFFNGHFEEFELEDNKAKNKYLVEKIKKIAFEEKDAKEEKILVPPLSTSEMIQKASIKLGLSPQKTMDHAQRLFESGLITYHRTSSKRVSQAGIKIAEEYIKENFGEKYFTPRTYSIEKGAHECIRPAKNIDPEELRILNINSNLRLNREQLKLYELVFTHFMASQMREAIVKKTTYRIKLLDERGNLLLEKENSYNTEIKQHGIDLLLEVKTYKIKKEYDIDKKTFFRRRKVKPYTYSEVVEEMRTKKIGRPSTYSIILQKLLDRNYIIERKNYLFSTRLGAKVLNFIKNNEKLYSFVREDYTRELEEQMDLIEQNKVDYQKILENLYNRLKEYLEYAPKEESVFFSD